MSALRAARCDYLGLDLAKLYVEPSQGDIFLDFEGDPFVGDGGLEYLFGYSFRGADGQERYVADWAISESGGTCSL